MKYVIIGAGPAGVIAAETLRKEDTSGSIIIIGDEVEPPYSRMALPYLLAGKVGEEGTYLRKAQGYFDSLDIEIRQGRVNKVDAVGKMVALDDGQLLPYNRLLLATGAYPITPPIPGMELPGIHSCWTLQDARHIARLAKPGACVLQIGAGFVGCIIMEALAKRGVHLTVVEMGNRMVPRMMTEVAGTMIGKWVEKKGVKVYTDTRVELIESADVPGVLRVCLGNGETLEADLVTSATGVRSNIGFLDGSGIVTDVGVLVDDQMRTNMADIFAAGDVAQARDFSTGKMMVNAIQPNAAEQSRIAALNMAGNEVNSPGSLAVNVLDTMGLIAASFGQWWGAEDGQCAELIDEKNFRYLSLQFKDDVLIGATSLGLTQHVGVLRGMIQSRTHLGEWKDHLLKNPTRIMEAYLAGA